MKSSSSSIRWTIRISSSRMVDGAGVGTDVIIPRYHPSSITRFFKSRRFDIPLGLGSRGSISTVGSSGVGSHYKVGVAC